jgi:hypothetical protein
LYQMVTMVRKSKLIETILLGVFILASWPAPPGLYAQTQGTPVATLVEKARAAGIPDDKLNQVLTLSVDHRLAPTDTSAILEVLLMAQRANLPVEPFVGKIEEGLAKGVPVQAIVAALEQKADDYRFVQTLLLRAVPSPKGQPVSNNDLTSIVNSLNRGVSRQELMKFIEEAPAAPVSMLAIAAENLALLRQMGFEETLTSRILFTGLRLKSFSPSWRYLPRIVLAARSKGMSDSDIAEAAVKALSEKRDVAGLMQMVGFTGRDLRHGPSAGSAKTP